MENVVIIGGGIAGTSAAEELRKLDASVNITIVEQEHHPLYSRVILGHYVNGKVSREKVFLKTWEWYEDQRIDVMPGVRVDAIDCTNRFVRTSEGRELPFDALVIAAGSELNTIGGEPRGVSYLRGIDDADELIALIHEVKMRPKEEQRAVVIGGGFIAFEYINIFAHFNIPCDVILRGKGFWSHVLSEHAQKVLMMKAEANGLIVHANVKEFELIGEKNIDGVRLADGTFLSAAIVGVGIGTHPEKSFFKEQGFDVERGILTNEYLETKYTNVYAVGDNAEFFDVHAGRSVCYGNWMNAQMQGRAVAKAIMGERSVFELVSSYSTNLFGLQMVFIGDLDRAAAEETKMMKMTEDASVEVFLRGGKIVAAILIGDVSERAAITAQIRENHYEP